MRYAPPSPFFLDLRQRVADDFAERGVPRHGGTVGLVYATAVLGGLVALHTLVLTDTVHGLAYFATQLGLGFLTYLVAVGIAHDASHGGLSRAGWINRAYVRLFDLAAVSSFVWTYDHLRSHHAAVNVVGHDNALETSSIMRVHPSDPHRPWHRFQHMYAWALYGGASLHRWFFHDWARLLRGRSGQAAITEMPWGERAWFLVGILTRNALFLVLPALMTSNPLANILLGFLAMHLLVSVPLIIAVQLTHQSEGAAFFEADETARIDEPWDRVILRATTDFAPDSDFVTWFTGGLNLHTIHHLFPQVHHRHLRRVNQLLVACAKDHGLKLVQRRTAWDAIAAHHRYLRDLGRGADSHATTPVASAA